MRIFCCIMVRDEEPRILKTMKSAAPHVDAFVIYDTGSVDRTIDVIKQYAEEISIPVYIKIGVFEGFSVSRNIMLEFAESYALESDILMLLDSNDEVRVQVPRGSPGHFREDLEKAPNGVNCMISTSYWSFGPTKSVLSHLKFLFIRPHKNMRYKRKRHEFIYENGGYVSYYYYAHNIDLYQDREYDDAKTQARYDDDIEVLKLESKEKETKVRALYYLGKTYMVTGKYEEAKNVLKHRSRLYEGDIEENYMTYIYLSDVYTILKKDKKAFKCLRRAYKCMQRIEVLIYLAKKYLIAEKCELSYMYTSVACTMKLPAHAHSYNYKDYGFDRHKLHAVTCLNTKRYVEGVDSLIKALGYEFALTQEEKAQLTEITNMYAKLAYMPFHTIARDSVLAGTRPKVMFVCGTYWGIKWDGRLVDSDDGIGGSELVAIKLAEYVAKYYDVYFVCDCEKPVIHNSVHYIPLISYISFLHKNRIHSLIVYRHVGLIKYLNVDNVYVSVEDLGFLGTHLELNTTLFKKVMYKSQWHKKYNDGALPVLSPYSVVLGNGIIPSRFNKPVKKIPGRIMWSSGATRGLSNVVRMMPRILATFPEAELHAFIDSKITDYGPETEVFKKLLENIARTPHVVVHPHISQDKLAEEAMKSEFWLYPTIMDETYCITALEMMAARVHCIYTPRGALSETVSPARGWEVLGDPCDESMDYKWIVAMLNCRINDYKLDSARQWALQQTWDRRGEELCQILNLPTKTTSLQ